MQSIYLKKILTHIAANKYKFIVLTFCFLAGCMSGYYTPENISHNLGSTIKYNLEERFLSAGANVTVAVLSMLYAGAVWIFGYTLAGVVLLPLMLMGNAALQVFLLRIIFLDIDLGGGFLAAVSILLFVFWSVCSLALCELSMENAAHLLYYRKWNMSLVEKAEFINHKALLFSVVSFLYILFSLLIFLVNRAIF